jgi:hypothetical protein
MSRRRYWAVATLAVLGVAGGGLWAWRRHAPSQGVVESVAQCAASNSARLGGAAGSERSYRLKYDAALCDETECASLVGLAGELLAQADVRDSGADEQLLVTLRLDAPTSEVQEGLPRAEALATPSLVAFSKDGTVQSIRQTSQVDEPTQRLLESVLRELQVRTPPCDGSHEWSAQEQLVALRVMSHFRVGPTKREIDWTRREILEWVETSSVFPVNGRATELAKSKHHASLDEAGRVERLSSRDDLVVELGDGGGRLTLRTTVELSSVGPSRPVTANPALGTPGIAAHSPQSEVADAARISGHTVTSLLGELARSKAVKSDGGPSASRVYVAASALFRRDDAAADQAAALIRSGHAERKFLTAALGDAGTLHSAELLAGLLREGQGDRAIETLVALGRARVVDEQIIDTMAAAMRDPQQAGTARLMLGAVASRSRDASPDASDRATGTLLANYDSADNVLARADVLRGLGNSGSLQALEAARRASTSASPIERAAAAQALRRIPSDAADRLLAMLLEDPDDSVRRSAFDAALYRDPTELTLPVVERCARLEEKSSVRREAIRVLVRWQAEAASARSTLAWVSINDPDQDLRKVAAEGLTRPGARGG